jgi:thioesterase domain-containing protein
LVGVPESVSRASVVVPLQQAARSRGTVLCFHALSGSVAPYGRLADYLAAHFDVYGVQSAGLEQDGPDRSIALMADRYAADIAHQSSGAPTILLGYCLGGVLAVATAERLQGLPVPISAVVTVDSSPVYTPESNGNQWRVLIEQTLFLDLDWRQLAARPRAEALEQVKTEAVRRRVLPPRFPIERLERMLDVSAANDAASGSYVPGIHRGALHVIRAAADLYPGADPWQPFADDVVLHPIDAPGSLLADPAVVAVAGVVADLAGAR